tara:strand:- start:600 stop:1001 length:402 start_codon:yes stop_codon:yes gene_type:complete
MNQKIDIGYKALIFEAQKIAKTVTVDDAKKFINNEDYIFIDLRDYREILREGKIPGSFSCPRGMLEFWIDPDSPYHKTVFNQKKHYVFYCASAWRSALSAKTAIEMGLNPVSHLEGGFSLWKKKGGTIETVKK